VRQRCIKEGRASWAQGGVCRGGNAKLQPQQPRIVTQKGLAVPHLGVQSPPELARRDLPSTLSSVLRDGKG
jgi:hypothetical protein